MRFRILIAIAVLICCTTGRAFAQTTIDAIHNIAGAYATIGSADMKWAQNWLGLGLDYYQIHFYDWMHPYSTDNLFDTRAEALELDRPVVVGEFPADHSTVAEMDEYLDKWYKSNYAGAWPWSFSGTDAYGRLPEGPLRAFARRHPDLVNPRALLEPDGPAPT